MWPFKKKHYCYYIVYTTVRPTGVDIRSCFTPEVSGKLEVNKRQLEEWQRLIGLRINHIQPTILSWRKVIMTTY